MTNLIPAISAIHPARHTVSISSTTSSSPSTEASVSKCVPPTPKERLWQGAGCLFCWPCFAGYFIWALSAIQAHALHDRYRDRNIAPCILHAPRKATAVQRRNRKGSRCWRFLEEERGSGLAGWNVSSGKNGYGDESTTSEAIECSIFFGRERNSDRGEPIGFGISQQASRRRPDDHLRVRIQQQRLPHRGRRVPHSRWLSCLGKPLHGAFGCGIPLA